MPEAVSLQDLLTLGPGAYTPEFLNQYSTEDLTRLAEELVQVKREARQVRQIQFYEVANPDALKIHLATTKEVIAVGGNRSSKTDTMLADAVICMTGIIPFSLEDVYPRSKIQCPMRVRLMCESLTNTWEPVIKQKLQWNKWNGRGEPGGSYGHWGWIPRDFLLRGKWDESWSEKNRTLTLKCGCTMQVMSYDQDVEDLSGASMHRILNDEPPPQIMYRENKMRTMDTGGQLYTAMTPSDDPNKAIRGSWIFEVYDRGLEGPSKDPDVTTVNLFTERNRILDADSIALIVKDLTPEQKETRLHGAFMHLTGRIYPIFTDRPRWWCFHCNDAVIAKLNGEVRGELARNLCTVCGSDDTCEFIHTVDPTDLAYTWPVVYVLDPHPRKGNMMAWYAIDPCDDWWQIAEMTLDLQPKDVRDKVFEFENRHKLQVCRRLIDPNMGASPAHNAGKRHFTVQDAFREVGIRTSLADDAFTPGRTRIMEMLKPDPRTRSPRFKIFRTCVETIKQFKNYVWDEYSANTETKDPKAVAMKKNDDFPSCARYMALSKPNFAGLRMTGQVVRGTRAKRVGAY